MKKKLLALLLGVSMMAFVSTSAFAEYVYVTKSGKKYHHSNSRYSTYEGVEKITLEEAIERGLEPSKSYVKFKEAEEQEVKEEGNK
ncbi:MAG: hypothetical protein H6755_03695 [Candidatus Omnitrophica bacterium]|nr:hypothetical protein [Candidatus Omnitrophota bacterium]MCB9747492.1 hypothetical protein [Candidatus Omnitrophota bacterium]